MAKGVPGPNGSAQDQISHKMFKYIRLLRCIGQMGYSGQASKETSDHFTTCKRLAQGNVLILSLCLGASGLARMSFKRDQLGDHGRGAICALLREAVGWAGVHAGPRRTRNPQEESVRDLRDRAMAPRQLPPRCREDCRCARGLVRSRIPSGPSLALRTAGVNASCPPTGPPRYCRIARFGRHSWRSPSKHEIVVDRVGCDPSRAHGQNDRGRSGDDVPSGPDPLFGRLPSLGVRLDVASPVEP